MLQEVRAPVGEAVSDITALCQLLPVWWRSVSVLARAMETLTSEMPSDASIEVSDGGRDNKDHGDLWTFLTLYLLIYCVTSQAQPQTFCEINNRGNTFLD